METSFGLVGVDYVILAADTTAVRSIVKMKTDEDKIKVLGNNLAMTYSGEPGDTIQFSEYIERNIRLYSIRHSLSLRPAAAAAWIRRALAESIRSRKPYSVNLLVGGVDSDVKGEEGAPVPELYWIDYLGTMVKVPFAAHGYGAYFAMSLLDRYHSPTATLEEGLATLRRCVAEINKRLVVSPEKWTVKVITRAGVKIVDL